MKTMQSANASMISLHSGDQLTRAEFERRWDALPRLQHAELIDGTTYVRSPVNHTFHGQPHALVVSWLGIYTSATPGLDLAAESSVRLDDRNMPQPDACLRLPEAAGGTSHVDRDDYLSGPPDLVVEVAASSVSYDLHQKLRVYERFGVREYVVWRTEQRAIDWFVLRDGRYERHAAGADGIVRSALFAGLWLDVEALLRGDLLGVRRVVDGGVATDEHRAFVARLRG